MVEVEGSGNIWQDIYRNQTLEEAVIPFRMDLLDWERK